MNGVMYFFLKFPCFVYKLKAFVFLIRINNYTSWFLIIKFLFITANIEHPDKKYKRDYSLCFIFSMKNKMDVAALIIFNMLYDNSITNFYL